jgi:hypothetical protein
MICNGPVGGTSHVIRRVFLAITPRYGGSKRGKSGQTRRIGFQAATVRKPTVALGEISFKELQAANRYRLNDLFERDDLSHYLTARHNFPENSVSQEGRQLE